MLKTVSYSLYDILLYILTFLGADVTKMGKSMQKGSKIANFAIVDIFYLKNGWYPITSLLPPSYILTNS